MEINIIISPKPEIIPDGKDRLIFEIENGISYFPDEQLYSVILQNTYKYNPALYEQNYRYMDYKNN